MRKVRGLTRAQGNILYYGAAVLLSSRKEPSKSPPPVFMLRVGHQRNLPLLPMGKSFAQIHQRELRVLAPLRNHPPPPRDGKPCARKLRRGETGRTSPSAPLRRGAKPGWLPLVPICFRSSKPFPASLTNFPSQGCLADTQDPSYQSAKGACANGLGAGLRDGFLHPCYT